MFVMSTAGHIDHGKSVLVQALTGIDPDRLREEKERGMTIDLGFAWLKLPSGKEVGIVDVPGHERFIGNMLAGVGGVDITLLVIAANEGVMPQTREHLAILDLLEIKKGVVAVTKKDLVDEEWLELVMMDIEELLKPTTLAGSPIVPVSVITRDGLPELLLVIDRLLETTEPKKDLGRPRLPIDRIFSITGAGTIVTGTLIDGSLEVGQEVEIVPKGLKSRIRGLQMHKTRVEISHPGSRTAVNLVGVNVDELERGDVLARPGTLKPTTLISCKLRLLDYIKHTLRHSSEVTFFSGATQVLAKVRLLDCDELKPGDSAWAQFILEKPAALAAGDHYIVRSTTDTLGGGKIIEDHARPLRRRRPEILQRLQVSEEGTVEEVVFGMLQTKQPVTINALLSQTHVPGNEIKAAVESLIGQSRLVTIGQGEPRLLMTAPEYQNTVKRASDIVQEYHKKYPLRRGMPKEELRNKLKLAGAGVSFISKLITDAVLTEEGTDVRLPGHAIKLTAAQQARMTEFLNIVTSNPAAVSTMELPEPDILTLLIQQNKIVKVSDGVIFTAAAYDEMVRKIVAHLKVNKKITLAEARDMLQTSRKYAQALLEFMDSQRITRRIGDDRVLL
jgi:selenocysteine-specific elongation factor